MLRAALSRLSAPVPLTRPPTGSPTRLSPVPDPTLTRRLPRPADGVPPDARESAEESLERSFELEHERELQLGGKPAHGASDGGQAVGGRG